MTKLKILNDFSHINEILEKSVMELFECKPELEILEAGCGQKWPLKLKHNKFKLTGVDLDQAALDIRINIVKDLDESIVGDLRYLDLGDRKFDVIYNSFVLEHVENAELVLQNLYSWLKPGGLLILKIPDGDTVFGFIAKTTPFWSHIAYKKYIKGHKNAGKPGFAPYPTYYNKIVSRNGIQRFCKSHNIVIREEIGSCAYLRNKFKNPKVLFTQAIAVLVSILSIGKLPYKYNNLTYLLEKK